MAGSNISPCRTALQERRHIDGQAAALQLLRRLQKMNFNRDAPAKSLLAVKAAIRCATTFPGKEFDRFSRVISEWLVADVGGLGFNLDEYEATLKKKGGLGQAAKVLGYLGTTAENP